MSSRKKPVPRKKSVKTVTDEEYTPLEMYCIWLNEYYKALRKAGFPIDVTLSLVVDKESYPTWVEYKNIDLTKYLDEDED